MLLNTEKLKKLSSHKLLNKNKRDEFLRGCLVCNFKQLFSVFKQHFMHFNALFHPHVFP